MRMAGQHDERPGAWSMFQENWPAILGATALGLSVALLGRWWLSGPNPPTAGETAVRSADVTPENEPASPLPNDSPPAGPVEVIARPAESPAEPAGWQFAPNADEPQEPVRVVSVEPLGDAAPTGAWLTGRIEEITEEPPLANAARLLDDLPVRR